MYLPEMRDIADLSDNIISNRWKEGCANLSEEKKRKFVDEYGNEIFHEPELLEVYGVGTVTGIARQVTQELIIRGMI